uniref:Uncharacterized protein n=1 Tax=Lepeophtheirus salmonis TaxID=72036 RepID=A0A0K2VEY3_LEPSM
MTNVFELETNDNRK